MKGHKMKRHSLLRMLKMTFPYWKIILLSVVCVIAVNAAEIYQPLIMRTVIDDFLVANKPEHGLYSINAMGILYMLLIAVSSILTVVQVNAMNHASQKIIYDLRKTVFSHIQRMPLSLLDK